MLSKFSVKKPYTVLVGVVLVITLGIVSFTRMTADLLPSISLPYVIVMTTYVGASPETVETVVTKPVESSMATVSNIESVSSVSSENYSMVILEFAQSTDMNAVSLEIRENLDQISSYWGDEVGNPIIMKLNPDMLPVMIAAVGMEGMDHGQISDYVEERIVPELESIEGVASVSATGLLEESINAVIRPEKLEALNEKIYAAIDEGMQEAAEELEKGKAELAKGRRELESGRQEILDGQAELEKGQEELEAGRQELGTTQQETLDELAQAKKDLLTAKTDLEASKLTINTNLTTAQTLESAIFQMDVILKAGENYLNASLPLMYDTYGDRLSDILSQVPKLPDFSELPKPQLPDLGDVTSGNPWWGDVTSGNVSPGNWPPDLNLGDLDLGDFGFGNGELSQFRAQLKEFMDKAGKLVDQAIPTGPEDLNKSREDTQNLKKNFLESTAVKQMASANDSMKELVERLTELDWTSPRDFPTVYGTLSVLAFLADTQMGEQRDNMQSALSALTSGVGLGTYRGIAGEALSTIEESLAQVDQGLVELEKGELTAAIEFAGAASKIDLGALQMELTKAQLDAAMSQLESGKAQLEEAAGQIEEGEKQLEEARESAYAGADLKKILSVDTVKALLTAQNFSMPAGYVTEDGVDYLVRVGDKPATLEDLQNLPLIDLHMEDLPVITLGDVADVFYTDNSADMYTNVNGSTGCILTMQKQTGYSTGEVSDLLGERFEKLMAEEEGLTIITLMDQGIYIDLVMDSILNNIIFGAGLSILILILFLRDLRPTFVIACSIPISLVTAVVCMYFSGITLNVISLSGLALGIGMLVDNSIVVIENIYRMRGEGRPLMEAAIEGAREVAGAIVASTLTTVCVFAPIVFTEGITRQLFVDMGLTIAYSLAASLVIALTVVPAMSSRVLSSDKVQKEGRFFGLLTRGYGKLLSGALAVKPLVIILSIALLAVSILLAVNNGIAFMSDMDSTQLTVNVTLPEDALLAETAQVTDQVVERILEIEDVENVGAMAQTSTMASLTGSGSSSSNSTVVYVVTREDKTLSNDELAALIQEKTADLKAEISVDTSSIDMSALGGSGISVQIRGRDLDTLQSMAREISEILSSVEGVGEVSDGLEDSSEELRITVDKGKAIEKGLTVAQVYTQVAARIATAGSATTLEAADRDYSVYVVDGEDILLTRELLRDLELESTDQEGNTVKVPLGEVADFSSAQALDSINRADQSRYLSVNAALAEGYNIGPVSAQVERALADYPVPDGYQLVFSGENETIMDAMEQVTLMLLLALLFMYLIMVAQFQSLLSPFIIMFTIPLAFTGGFLGLVVSGSEISVVALIGFVMLSGIIVNNGIVLVDYMNQLREKGMEKKEAILTAGRTRLRPVLMTALTTILALSTMVFSTDMGSEMAKPMAIVTIGGLLYGTLLTLVVIPCIYDIFMRKKKKTRRAKKIGMNSFEK